MGTISLDLQGSQARLTLSNPAKFNAMSRSMWRELKTRMDDLSAMPALRCVILAGEGGHFCAGGDIAEYPAFRSDEAALRAFHEEEVWPALQALLDCPVPLVAQIEGNCMGSGFLTAVVSDVAVADEATARSQRIAAQGPQATRLNKQTLRRLQSEPAGDRAWADAYASASIHEHRAGIAAFLAKRNPTF